MRVLLFLWVALGASLISAAAGAVPDRNILLILADDLNCDLGCYGAAEMVTPHIDRLAARGIRCDKAYCQYPSCAPSRASFLTGRRPNATRVLLNPGGPNPYTAHFRSHIADTVTLLQLFKQNGWFSARVGKLYHRASVSFMDAQVGRVLDALDRLSLARNTIVVFTSVHGYHLGDHGLWQKGSLFERSLHVPLIIAAPGLQPKGETAPGVVELLDLYPTLAELCRRRTPGYLEGTSLVPVLRDAKKSVKTVAFSQVMRRASGREGFPLRSGRWRYTEWDVETGIVRQLFDAEADPAETTDLAGRPEHVARMAEFQRLIAAQRRRDTKPLP